VKVPRLAVNTLPCRLTTVMRKENFLGESLLISSQLSYYTIRVHVHIAKSLPYVGGGLILSALAAHWIVHMVELVHFRCFLMQELPLHLDGMSRCHAFYTYSANVPIWNFLICPSTSTWVLIRVPSLGNCPNGALSCAAFTFAALSSTLRPRSSHRSLS